MKLFLIGLTLIIGASCQIYTQIGEDGYKYPKPQARFNLPEPIEAEPACSNGGSGQFCCTNGAENADCCDNGGRGAFCCTNVANNPDCSIPTQPPVTTFRPALCGNGAPDSAFPDCCTNGGSGSDCCTNGGRGQFCCSNGANNQDCCENGGSGPFCCSNGASNADCCDNGGRGAFCCTNGANNPDCSIPTQPPVTTFRPALCGNGAPDSAFPDCCTNGGRGQDCCINGGSGPDCCTNGGRGQFCCSNGANNQDCCENGGSGPFCCSNGASNADCCDNGGRGAFCCTNGANNPDCSIPTQPPVTTFRPALCGNGAPDSAFPDCCTNGGRGQDCCINGGSGPDCCTNGGRGQFCCSNGANNQDCCENGGSGPFCCSNGASNADCCDNGGRGAFCCTNGANNPDCSIPTQPPVTTFRPALCGNGAPDSAYPDCCTNGGRGQYCCTNGLDSPSCELVTLPPLPSFIPTYNFPKVIPVEPLPMLDERIIDETPEPFIPLQTPPPIPSFISIPSFPKIIPVRPIVVSTPAPFAPAPLPVKPVVIPQVQSRTFAETTKSPNEYLPPFDVRSGETPDWSSWKAKYRKRYANPTEEKHRQAVFEDNVEQINLHNNEFEAGLVSYDLDVNKFGDLTQDEFLTMHTGLKRDSRSNEGHSTLNVFMPSPILEMMVEDEVDWRKKGAVTAVKDQGSCASCWAFAANGAMEAQNFLAKGKLVSLSEQNLIDCVKENDGCDGGYMTNAYDYVRLNPGVDTESSYPYEAKNTTCRFNPANIGGECMAHMEIMIGNEKALLQAVATVGPVAAGIDGAKRSFQFYKSGYYYEPKCETEVNHAVLIVGYGKTEQGEEYWICKNSWGESWGESGYIRMARNKKNHCGITSLASYPLV